MPNRLKVKEYYAVVRSEYLDTPTIFSSWGRAHPIVTGVSGPVFKGFHTFHEATEYIEHEVGQDYVVHVTSKNEDTSPVNHNVAYYAVANGRNPGIFAYDYGSAKAQVQEFPGICQKNFRTRQQAEAFIQDWNESYADVVRRRVLGELREGYRPEEMKGGRRAYPSLRNIPGSTSPTLLPASPSPSGKSVGTGSAESPMRSSPGSSSSASPRVVRRRGEDACVGDGEGDEYADGGDGSVHGSDGEEEDEEEPPTLGQALELLKLAQRVAIIQGKRKRSDRVRV